MQQLNACLEVPALIPRLTALLLSVLQAAPRRIVAGAYVQTGLSQAAALINNNIAKNHSYSDLLDEIVFQKPSITGIGFNTVSWYSRGWSRIESFIYRLCLYKHPSME